MVQSLRSPSQKSFLSSKTGIRSLQFQSGCLFLAHELSATSIFAGKNVFLASGLYRRFTVIWGYTVAKFDSFQLLCVGAAFINESEMQYLWCQNSSTTVLILFLYLQPLGWKCFLCNLVLCLENKNLKEHFMSCQIKTRKGMYLRKGSKGSRPPPLPFPFVFV